VSVHLQTFRKPALVGTDVCFELALGVPEAGAFFETTRFDLRLSTATFLALLQHARSREEVARIRRFVQVYPVLSLGPMASSRAVQLLLDHTLTTGLDALQALAAATALAHEIPLLTRDPERYRAIPGLEVVSAY
jgi:predicted nucleic acid-binding protein